MSEPKVTERAGGGWDVALEGKVYVVRPMPGQDATVYEVVTLNEHGASAVHHGSLYVHLSETNPQARTGNCHPKYGPRLDQISAILARYLGERAVH